MNALPDTPLLSDDGTSASPTLFDPAQSDPRLLRSALGRFATGVDPDFATRLRAAGAWAVVDAEALAALCGVSRG